MSHTGVDRPCVENYPPLLSWLTRHDGRCNWRLPMGDKRSPVAMVESWVVGSGEVIIVVQARQHGWNVYTPLRGDDIEASLADAEERAGLRPERLVRLAATRYEEASARDALAAVAGYLVRAAEAVTANVERKGYAYVVGYLEAAALTAARDLRRLLGDDLTGEG